jgi:hypothetical protein
MNDKAKKQSVGVDPENCPGCPKLEQVKERLLKAGRAIQDHEARIRALEEARKE